MAGRQPAPTGRNQSAQLELKVKVMVDAPKKKRGRPPKTAQQSVAATPSDDDDIRTALRSIAQFAPLYFGHPPTYRLLDFDGKKLTVADLRFAAKLLKK